MMPPPDQTPLDIVSVVVVIITALAGGQVAMIAGPYAVIVGAAVVCASFALMRRPEYGVLRSVGFVLGVTAFSVLVTGAASVVAAKALGMVGVDVHAYYLLVPISGLIAYVGPDWPQVASWAARLLRRRIERRMESDK